MGLRGGRAGGRAPAAPDRHGGIGPFYDALKNAVESRDVFVAQAGFPVGEAQGLALVGDGPPVIVVNSADAAESRAFTLLHEYAHVLLAGGSLCRPASEGLDAAESGSGKAIEGWCDSSASSVLMPRIEFLTALGDGWGRTMDEVLAALSQRFLLSRRAVLVRAIGLTEGLDREAYLGRYRGMGPPPERLGSPGGWRVPLDAACLHRCGRRYVQLVSDSEEAGIITECDMAMYLDLRATHFDSLRARIDN